MADYFQLTPLGDSEVTRFPVESGNDSAPTPSSVQRLRDFRGKCGHLRSELGEQNRPYTAVEAGP